MKTNQPSLGKRSDLRPDLDRLRDYLQKVSEKWEVRCTEDSQPAARVSFEERHPHLVCLKGSILLTHSCQLIDAKHAAKLRTTLSK